MEFLALCRYIFLRRQSSSDFLYFEFWNFSSVLSVESTDSYQWSQPIYIRVNRFILVESTDLYRWIQPIYIGGVNRPISAESIDLYRWSQPFYIGGVNRFISVESTDSYRWSQPIYIVLEFFIGFIGFIGGVNRFISVESTDLYRWSQPIHIGGVNRFISMFGWKNGVHLTNKNLNNSVGRNLILETYPDIQPYTDNFLPKKDQFKVRFYEIIVYDYVWFENGLGPF